MTGWQKSLKKEFPLRITSYIAHFYNESDTQTEDEKHEKYYSL